MHPGTGRRGHRSGETSGLGTPNRWLAPTTDGTRLLAVHTPHIGGVLHDYHVDGNRLVSRAVAQGVSTHRIGSRELDLAVWLGPRLVLPQQDGLALRVLDANAAWAEVAFFALPERVAMTAALPEGQAWRCCSTMGGSWGWGSGGCAPHQVAVGPARARHAAVLQGAGASLLDKALLGFDDVRLIVPR